MKAIYKITNKLNGKIYIGQSVHPEQRWEEHCYKHTNYKSFINQAIQCYGKNNFEFEILGWFENYNEKEQEFIQQYNSLAPNGYNFALGGEEPPTMIGEDNPAAKITQEIAESIQQDLMRKELSRTDIINKYNVTSDIVRHINEGTTWHNSLLKYPLRESAASLKQDKIDAIKNALISSKKTQKEIAEEFGMARTAVTAINNGQNWYDPNLDYPLRKTNRQKKPILQLDIDTGEIIKEYPSIADAARAFGKTSNVMFSRCLNGTAKSAYGFFWKYKED